MSEKKDTTPIVKEYYGVLDFLKNNMYVLQFNPVTSAPYSALQVYQYLKKTYPNVKTEIKNGQITVVSSNKSMLEGIIDSVGKAYSGILYELKFNLMWIAVILALLIIGFLILKWFKMI